MVYIQISFLPLPAATRRQFSLAWPPPLPLPSSAGCPPWPGRHLFPSPRRSPIRIWPPLSRMHRAARPDPSGRVRPPRPPALMPSLAPRRPHPPPTASPSHGATTPLPCDPGRQRSCRNRYRHGPKRHCPHKQGLTPHQQPRGCPPSRPLLHSDQDDHQLVGAPTSLALGPSPEPPLRTSVPSWRHSSCYVLRRSPSGFPAHTDTTWANIAPSSMAPPASSALVAAIATIQAALAAS